jgi:hypothetical protein
MARTTLLALLALLGACRAGKSDDATPAPVASASSAIVGAEASLSPPAGIPRKLCTDGVHRGGDHWKDDCNPCRCAADGDITCTHFACPAKPEGGLAPEAGTKADAGAPTHADKPDAGGKP